VHRKLYWTFIFFSKHLHSKISLKY
jgi:hypothetical protein